MLYFAYGANLSKAGMGERCPAAVAVGIAVLHGYRRVFRPWADVEPASGSQVEGGLWRITPACLAALDDYEEVEAGLYRRLTLAVAIGARDVADAFIYRMNAAHDATPEADYLSTILRGCRDFGLPEGQVLAAVAGSDPGRR